MKNKTLRCRTDSMLKGAEVWEKWFGIGCDLEETGRLIQHMAMHIADLQIKIDNQAEELKRHQGRKHIDDIVEKLEKQFLREENIIYMGIWRQAIEIVKGETNEEVIY